MLQKAFWEMKDKTNFTSTKENRQTRVFGSTFTYQAGNRHKRFVTTLMSLAFEGFKTYISHKAAKKLIKGMKIIWEKIYLDGQLLHATFINNETGTYK